MRDTRLVGIVGQADFTSDELHEINVRMWEEGPEATALRDEFAEAQQRCDDEEYSRRQFEYFVGDAEEAWHEYCSDQQET